MIRIDGRKWMGGLWLAGMLVAPNALDAMQVTWRSVPTPPAPPAALAAPAPGSAPRALAMARALAAPTAPQAPAALEPLAALPALDAPGAPWETVLGRSAPPASWAPQDPADSLYRAARRALNARSYREAARMYAQIRSEHPRSTYVADSYYWQALAYHRTGGIDNLERAMALIDEQVAGFPDAATAEDARELALRIQADRARRGNATAAAQIARSASGSCDDEDERMRAAALSALLQMDSDRARPILLEVLRDRDECSAELREQAIFLLAQNPDAETVDLLVDLAVENPDDDVEVRQAAVFWLSQVRTEQAFEALLDLLEAENLDPEMREQAVFAVANHSSPRVAQILRDYVEREDLPGDIRENAVFWLGQREDGVEYLRQLYGRVGDDPAIRERILFSVAQRRSAENQEWLIQRALDPRENEEVRKQALFWAGESGISTERVLSIYSTAEDRELREQAIFVLSQRETEEAVTAMMRIAREEEDPELKENAVFWLGQSRDPRVPEFLLELIRGGGGGA